MGFYEDRRKTADTLLKKYGMPMYIRDNTVNETYNPATGVVTQGAPAAIDYPCTGLVYPLTKGKKSGGNEDNTTQRVVLSAEGLALAPEVKHQLIVNSKVYEIGSVTPLEPGGVVVLYELSVSA